VTGRRRRRARAITACLIAAWLSPALAHAQVPAGVYKVETIAGPPGIAPEMSAMAFAADGRLYVCFRRGSIYAFDPADGRWRKFASGLQTPLGIVPGAPGEFFVMQTPELTRVVDTDGDGVADLYQTVSDAWGMSGNYHEFVGGPVRDRDGSWVVSLGSASGAARPRLPVRGPLVPTSRDGKEEKPGFVNRTAHYSPVPYRGCVVRVAAATGDITPVACGLRQPDGLVLSPQGALFATDNQGDWVGTSPLHHVTQGAFHGHPASLRWDPTWKGGDPLDARVDDLAKRRKMPAIQFPQNDMAGSVGQPVFDLTGGRFGPYSGQMIVPEWTYPRLLRVDLEEVNGQYQGAAFILLEGTGLRLANHRMAFAPDGKSLYVAQTSRMWSAIEGLQRVTWTGKTAMDILHMRIGHNSFELSFTKPIDNATARDPAAWSFSRYHYLYHSQYGSPKTDVESVKVTAVDVAEGGMRVTLHVDPLTPGRVYELRPTGIKAADGEPLATRLAAYTVNQIKAR
jgi:glucose/arabinose dehydrogenase